MWLDFEVKGCGEMSWLKMFRRRGVKKGVGMGGGIVWRVKLRNDGSGVELEGLREAREFDSEVLRGRCALESVFLGVESWVVWTALDGVDAVRLAKVGSERLRWTLDHGGEGGEEAREPMRLTKEEWKVWDEEETPFDDKPGRKAVVDESMRAYMRGDPPF